MVLSLASGIVVQAISLIVARMIGSAWRRREVRTIFVVVVQFILMSEDERGAVLVLVNPENSSQYSVSENHVWLQSWSPTGRTDS